MPILNPAIGTNRYCGPGALAVITGCSTDETAARLRLISGKRAIRRIGNTPMINALASYGYYTRVWLVLFSRAELDPIDAEVRDFIRRNPDAGEA